MKGVYGQDTGGKQKDFESILQHHLTVCRYILKPSHYCPIYRYIDVFGGPGRYSGIDGSPLIFQRLIRRFNFDYKADIFEVDRTRYLSLCQYIESDKIQVSNGDNQTLLGQLELDHPHQYGLLYCDPPQDEGTLESSFAMMELAAAKYSKLDLMLYISPAILKRIRCSRKGGSDLQDHLDRVAKNHWAIRSLKNKHQWTFLIGTNYIKWADWKSRGFYPVDSPEGWQVFDKANYTKEELKKKLQPQLTGLMESTCDTPNLELSERKPFKGPKESVKDAIIARLRKFIT